MEIVHFAYKDEEKDIGVSTYKGDLYVYESLCEGLASDGKLDDSYFLFPITRTEYEMIKSAEACCNLLTTAKAESRTRLHLVCDYNNDNQWFQYS